MLLVCVALVAGCSSHANRLSGPDATPAARTTTATTIDVCDLVTADTASTVLDRSLQVVGRTVGPARETTVECDLGERFGEPLVAVSLAPEPISRDVFDAAYGDPEGGNPGHLQQFGDAAYVRTEGTQRVIHVFVHGAVLSVSATLGAIGSPDLISMAQLRRLTRAAVAALPDNPAVELSTAPQECGKIDGAVLADTLGRPPRLSAGLGYSDRALVCSWSGQPGSVTVWMTDDPAVISRFLDRHPLDLDVAVTGILPRSQGQAYSSPKVAGDLVVLAGPDRLMTVQVIPAAGYADDGIDTSASEVAVAQAGLDLMADLT